MDALGSCYGASVSGSAADLRKGWTRKVQIGGARSEPVTLSHETPDSMSPSTALARPGFLTTTENQLTGYRIIERLGVVRGITVRSRSVVGLFGAKIQQFFGGDISLLEELCEQTRAAAFAHTGDSK